MRRDRFMREAARLALENVRRAEGGPFGAIVARGDQIVATGVNTVTRTNDPTAHAEVNAIRAAGHVLGAYDLSGCELYSSCEPCPMCLAAVYWARIRKVHYGCTAEDAAAFGFDDAFIYRELRLPPAERSLDLIQRERESCLAAFRAWEASTRKTSY